MVAVTRSSSAAGSWHRSTRALVSMDASTKCQRGSDQGTAAAALSDSLPASQQDPAAAGAAQVPRHVQQRSSKRSTSGAVLALVVLLLVSLSASDAAPTQCRVAPPVCPSRSEALARKPMFDIESPQTVQLEAGPTSGSKVRKHKASTAAAASQSPAGARHSWIPHMSREAAVSLLMGMYSRKERLFLWDSAAAHAQDMPQRVVPTADLPALSEDKRQEVFSQLLDVLQGSSVNSSIVVGAAADAAPAAAGSAQVPAAGSGTLFLENARLRVGVDTSRGGAITYVSSAVMPPEWSNVNLVNTWDAGRLIQQSYYGCYDNTCWVDRPWRWNPVQGGSWQNGPPKLLASSMGAASITVASVPRNWGGQQLLDDVLMVTETELHPNVLKVRFAMRYTGNASHPDAHQELPAVFVNRRLNVLALYTGEKPWSNGDLTFIMPGQKGEYYRPTERWAAYVDQESGFGLGVYTPVATQLVAYRIGPEKSAAPNDVSYMAPLVTANIQPNTEIAYDAYIAVGRVDQMRGWFKEIAARVAPTNEAGSYKRPLSLTPLQTPLPALQQHPGGGRSSEAARLPRVSKLVGAQHTAAAVKVSPGGSDAVGFAKALPASGGIDFDSQLVRPPPAGVKLTPKPSKKASPPAPPKQPSTPVKQPSSTPAKQQQAGATVAPTDAQPKALLPPRNARLGRVRKEAGHAQASTGAMSLDQQSDRWARPTIPQRPAVMAALMAATPAQLAPAQRLGQQPGQQQQQPQSQAPVQQPLQQQLHASAQSGAGTTQQLADQQSEPQAPGRGLARVDPAEAGLTLAGSLEQPADSQGPAMTAPAAVQEQLQLQEQEEQVLPQQEEDQQQQQQQAEEPDFSDDAALQQEDEEVGLQGGQQLQDTEQDGAEWVEVEVDQAAAEADESEGEDVVVLEEEEPHLEEVQQAHLERLAYEEAAAEEEEDREWEQEEEEQEEEFPAEEEEEVQLPILMKPLPSHKSKAAHKPKLEGKSKHSQHKQHKEEHKHKASSDDKKHHADRRAEPAHKPKHEGKPKHSPHKEEHKSKGDGHDASHKKHQADKRAEKHADKRAEVQSAHADRHADKQAEKHTDKHVERHADKHAEKHAEKHADKHAERLAEKHAEVAAEKQAEKRAVRAHANAQALRHITPKKAPHSAPRGEELHDQKQRAHALSLPEPRELEDLHQPHHSHHSHKPRWSLVRALAARRAAAKARNDPHHKAKTSAPDWPPSREARLFSLPLIEAPGSSRQQHDNRGLVAEVEGLKAQMAKQDLKALRKRAGKPSNALVPVSPTGEKKSVWASLSSTLQKVIEVTTQALQPQSPPAAAEPPKNELPKCGTGGDTASICF